MEDDTDRDLDRRMVAAWTRYGDFASTSRSLGVCLEEWDELKAAVQANALESVREEALDLAAACLRLAESARNPSIRATQPKVKSFRPDRSKT
jgi:NTP pyrophosphatase (non-canonical NTP hydrolase)